MLFKTTLAINMTLMSCLTAHGQLSEELVARFEAGAPGAWREFVLASEKVTGIVATKQMQGKMDGREGGEKTSIEYLRKGKSFVSQMEMSGRDLSKLSEDQKKRYNAKVVSGKCHEYFFTILNYGGDRDWVLQYAGALAQGKGSILPFSGVGVSLPGVEVPFTCLDPKSGYAKAIAGKSIEFDGKDLVEIEFRFLKSNFMEDIGTGTPHEIDLTPAKSVRVAFDPNKWWLPMTSEIAFSMRNTPGIAKAVWDYGFDASMPLGPIKREKSIRSDKIDIKELESFRYDTAIHDDSRFRLTYYGLPEPESGGRRSYYWYILIGVLLVGISYWFKRRTRRK